MKRRDEDRPALRYGPSTVIGVGLWLAVTLAVLV